MTPLAMLSDDALDDLLAQLAKRLAFNRIEDYYPAEGPLRRELYPKHLAYFAAGAEKRIRMMMAANRVGKTEGVGGYELVLHMTGDYPEWWIGKRFDRPVRVWAAGDTSKTVREILQTKLLGPWGEFGTGLIPSERLGRWTPKQGVAEAVDTFNVKHRTGGISRCVLKSYDQKRESFQGTEQDIILLDEEPPLDIYSECVTRTMTTDGLIMLTFTPLSGVTKLIKHLRSSKTWEVNATWDDVPHLSQQAKDELWAATPEYMREARAKGIPARGSGVVYPVSRHTLEIEPFRLPPHWHRINGMDFGWSHPSAAVHLVHDTEADTIYVTQAYSKKEATPLIFAAAVKPWGAWVPTAWPHDGMRRDKDPQAGRKLADLYAAQGLNMLPEPASWSDEKLDNSVEPGIVGILDYMMAGRLKVFRHLSEWWREWEDYHREDGVIVKEDDDIMDATRMGFMMRRHAIPIPAPTGPRRDRSNWRTV